MMRTGVTTAWAGRSGVVPASSLIGEGILGHRSQLVPVRIVGDAMGQIGKQFHLAGAY